MDQPQKQTPGAEDPGFQMPYPSASDPNSSGAEKPPKRRKVAIACDECRVRKTKCDGVQPVCGPCMKRQDAGVNCTYGTGRQRRSGYSKDYVAGLENRLKDLERGDAPSTNGSSRPLLGQANPSPVRAPIPASQATPARAVYPSAHQYPNSNAPEYRPAPSVASTPASQDRDHYRKDSKGVNAMMGAVDEPQGHGFFGSSSAASFIQQIKTAVDAKVTSPETHPSGMVLGKVQLSSLEQRQKASPVDYVLPPRKTADGLLEIYWRLVHPLYPFLDRYEIMNQYQKLWTGEAAGCDENALMTTLNVMFAVSCQLSDTIDPSQREASAAVFFSRAKELLDFDLWEAGSVQTIQCLLIMSQYLQSTNSAHQCWVVVGMAVRTAQSLGFHLPQTDAQFKSSREMELARRLWHGCVMMDRIVSLTFGRPFMISRRSAEAVPLPAAIDDEYLSDDPRVKSRQPKDRFPIMAFFPKSLELYGILSRILTSLYDPADNEPPSPITDIYGFYFGDSNCNGLSNVFELDRCLTNWALNLPVYLRANTSESTSHDTLFRQTNILRARFLHIRMLLFRPIMSRFCITPDVPTSDLQTSLELPQRVALQCSALCVNVAQETVELIYKNVEPDGSTGPLPAWWYNILYVYTAATILLAARLRPQIIAEIPEAGIKYSWDCALEILRKYGEYSTSAKRCVAALEILYARIQTGPQGQGQERDRDGITAGWENQLKQTAGGAGAAMAGQAQQSEADMLNATQGIGAGVSMPQRGQGQVEAFVDGNMTFDGAWFDSLDFGALGDMSWLSSVPSNL